ncbi:hypothetical protein L3X38_004883 [Prunus dulcis]|uniref:Secreted protein n=1 Tax=Prunus dulcis TaxID=3755 RepID=A0AAD5F3K3_PRUDU|nr:hypothetical protein L3X38_004883 [Prunus dulcis]
MILFFFVWVSWLAFVESRHAGWDQPMLVAPRSHEEAAVAATPATDFVRQAKRPSNTNTPLSFAGLLPQGFHIRFSLNSVGYGPSLFFSTESSASAPPNRCLHF